MLSLGSAKHQTVCKDFFSLNAFNFRFIFWIRSVQKFLFKKYLQYVLVRVVNYKCKVFIRLTTGLIKQKIFLKIILSLAVAFFLLIIKLKSLLVVIFLNRKMKSFVPYEFKNSNGLKTRF